MQPVALFGQEKMKNIIEYIKYQQFAMRFKIYASL